MADAPEIAGTIHILHTPMEEVSRKPNGERWCFVCRKRREFEHVITRPVLDPNVPLEDQTGAWYGPTHQIECGTCHTVDGDCFPGREREWYDD
jgi:hypothetical protein